MGCPAPVIAGREVRVDDKDRGTVTVVQAVEYLGPSRTTVHEMVNRGLLKADRFAGAVRIPAKG